WMLELWSPDDAFGRIEAHLRDAGFFAGPAGAAAREGLVADLYLGHGLSRNLRREGWPDPPEPCPLPFAAVQVRPEREPPPDAPADAMHIGAWTRSWDDTGYAAGIRGARDAIAAGEVYQVNLVQ